MKIARLLRCFASCLLLASTMLSTSIFCRAETTVNKHGSIVELQNELVKVDCDLAKGTYSAYSRKEKSSSITNGSLKIDGYSSDTSGLNCTWKSSALKDGVGAGRMLQINFAGHDRPELILQISLYDHKSLISIGGGITNSLGKSLRVNQIEPLFHAKAFEGLSPKSDLRMLNGPGGAGLGPRMDGVKQEIGDQTKVRRTNSMECPNNLLATYLNVGKRHSIVLGGLTYHDYTKIARAALSVDGSLAVGISCWDPVGKLVEPGSTYMPDDRCYIDFCTSNPFEALEQYGLSIRAAQKVNLRINDFPTVDGWYVAVFSGGGSEPNNSAGMVALMDAAKKSGFLKYSKVGIRLIPDEYGANNEQGWWDEAHWQKYGHYVKPYETTKKWAQAVIELGGIPLIYSQTTSNSRDFIAAHPDWYLYNDTSRLFDSKGELSYKSTLDFTDPGLKTHLSTVYENMKVGGLAGLMFDYPENAFRLNGGFEDSHSTSTAAYRSIFALPKQILGPNSYIDERNVWAEPDGRGCFSDMTVGVVDSQRVWGDNDTASPEMYSRCGNRWYKNRVIYTYDMDSKNLFKVSPNNRDGLRQLLTMAYTAAPRLVLANSFSKMTAEQLHDLSRIYPVHTAPRSARPLDAFTREDGIPHIYDFMINKSWHQLAFYNPDVKESETIGVDLSRDSSMGGMGLDKQKSYYIYDFWNDKFLGKINGNSLFEQKLRPGEVRMMSVHEAENHPQFLSTNRHVMQGYIDVLKSSWNQSANILAGTSKIIGGETYKLVIAVSGHHLISCTAKGAKSEIKMIDAANGLAELRIDSVENANVDWTISCEEISN